MERHQATTAEMLGFLRELPQVAQVYFPDIDGEQLTSYGGILFFQLRNELVERYGDFSRRLKLFSTGTGMACVTSMVAQPYTGSHASMSDEQKNVMGLGPDLVRLSFGMEDPGDLKQDLLAAFAAIESDA